MKTTSVFKLIAIGLVLIFIAGPAAAGVFDQLEGLVQEKQYSKESAKVSGYKSSAQYSLLEHQFAKPGLDVYTATSVKPRSDLAKIDFIEKDLWQSLPATGPYCPTCAFNNATKSFGSVFTEKYKGSISKFYFGGGGPGGSAGGGGCCG